MLKINIPAKGPFSNLLWTEGIWGFQKSPDRANSSVHHVDTFLVWREKWFWWTKWTGWIIRLDVMPFHWLRWLRWDPLNDVLEYRQRVIETKNDLMWSAYRLRR